MPPEGVVIIVAIGCGAVIMVVKMIASTVLRLQERQQRPLPHDVEERLARIEAAVESIAIEVERSGELQRFSARLAERAALPEPPRQ